MLALVFSLIAALPTNDVRVSAQRGVALIQKVNAQWKTPCISCHHQVLGNMALESARAHGLAVDEKVAQTSSTRDFKLLLDLDAAVRVDQLIDPAFSEGSMLLGAHAAGIKPSLVTTAYARHIAGNQQPDGHWATFDSRPPHGFSQISAAAIGARAVALYHPEPERFVMRARQWLSKAEPTDTEDASFRLLGLHWTRAGRQELEKAAAQVLKLQRADGGWGQVDALTESDAYSTGQAIAALRESGAVPADDKRVQAGIEWLVKHQAADGSWHVKTRLHSKAPISPPYFESGYPHGHDQFISMAGATWAVRALAGVLPMASQATSPLPILAFDDSKLAWARTVLNGSVDDLDKINPNSATAGGTTALMMAAYDPERVERLLARGANAKAVAATGYDALMMAALYHGNARTASLLLNAGALPAPPASRKVRFDASPLALAVMADDPALVELLLQRKASLNRGMRLLGMGDPTSLLNLAVGFGNDRIIKLLVQAGAKVNEADSMGMTPLSWAALGSRATAAKMLLELGADPKHKDKFGMTPLDHTKVIDHAPAETARLLSSR